MRRKDVTFSSRTDTCAAWLYAPADGRPEGSVPLIVMAHGLTGTRRDRLGPFAGRFADAGVAALVFDRVHQRLRGRGRLAPRRLDRRGLWRNRASAGWLLSDYRPIRRAETLHCPWLVCVAEADAVARPGPAIAAGRRAPKGTVRTYAGVGHFDIYDGPEHEAVVADEVEFLRRHRFASG